MAHALLQAAIKVAPPVHNDGSDNVAGAPASEPEGVDEEDPEGLRRALQRVLDAVVQSSTEQEQAVTKATHARSAHRLRELERERAALDAQAMGFQRLMEEDGAPPAVRQSWHKLWDNADHMERISAIACVSPNDDRHFYAAASADGTVTLQVLSSGTKKPQMTSIVSDPEGDAILCLAFIPIIDLPDSFVMVTGTESGALLYTVPYGNEDVAENVATIGNIVERSQPVVSIAGALPGIVAIASGRKVELWEVEGMAEGGGDPHWALDHSGPVSCVRMPARHLVSTLSCPEHSTCAVLSLWDLRQRDCACRVPAQGLASNGQGFVFDAVAVNSGILLAAAAGHSVQTWDLRQVLRPLSHCDSMPGVPQGTAITTMALEPSGGRLMSLGCTASADPGTGALLVRDSLAELGCAASVSLIEAHNPVTVLRWASNPEQTLLVGDVQAVVTGFENTSRDTAERLPATVDDERGFCDYNVVAPSPLTRLPDEWLAQPRLGSERGDLVEEVAV